LFFRNDLLCGLNRRESSGEVREEGAGWWDLGGCWKDRNFAIATTGAVFSSDFPVLFYARHGLLTPAIPGNRCWGYDGANWRRKNGQLLFAGGAVSVQ